MSGRTGSIIRSSGVTAASACTSSFRAWTSVFENAGVISSFRLSGSRSIIDSFAYPMPRNDSCSLSELPPSENLSLILMNLDTCVLSRLYSAAANSLTSEYAVPARIAVSLATFSRYPILTKLSLAFVSSSVSVFLYSS